MNVERVGRRAVAVVAPSVGALVGLAVVAAIARAFAAGLVGTDGATVLAALAVGGVVATGLALGWPSGPAAVARVVAYCSGMVVVALAVLVACWALAFALLVPTFDGAAAGLAATVLTATLGVVALVGLALAVADGGRDADWALRLRMVLAMGVVALCALVLYALTWAVTFVLALVQFDPPVAALVGAVAAALFVVWTAVAEYRQVAAVEARADATVVDREDAPDLHARVTRLAAQLDVPVPTIAVADREVPEAMVVGFRPSNTHLILSTGTLRALDGDELDAALAHELAHVANRDAMVMTVLSAPMLVAGSYWRWHQPDETPASLDDTTGASDADSTAVGDSDLTEAELYGEDGEWRMGASAADEGDEDDEPSFLDRVWTDFWTFLGRLFLLVFVGPVALVTWATTRVVTAVLSRARETAADRTAVEVLGTPAALAGALRTLDDRIAATPRQDLREVAGISALSILPLGGGVVGEGADGASLRNRLVARILRTHPRTAERIETLEELAREE